MLYNYFLNTTSAVYITKFNLTFLNFPRVSYEKECKLFYAEETTNLNVPIKIHYH